MENFKALFFKKFYGTDRTSDILNMMKRDFNKIKSYVDVITLAKKYMPFVYLGNSEHTISTRFTEIKKLANNAKIADKYKTKLIDVFTAPDGFYEALNELKEQRVFSNNKEKELNFNLADFDKIISELYKMGMDETLKNYPYKIGSRQTKEQIRAYYLAAYLALTTGRRLTEILKTMELRKYKDHLKVKGILKKKKEDKNNSYNLIALDDINKILKAYRELRRIFDTSNLTERQVNQKHNAKFNEFLKTKIFSNSDLTFHDLRKIYLLKAYEKFGNNEDFDNFAEKALIHDVKLDAKFKTQTSYYTDVKIKGDKDE